MNQVKEVDVMQTAVILNLSTNKSDFQALRIPMEHFHLEKKTRG